MRSYSIAGSGPEFWLFARSSRLDKFCAAVVIYPYIRRQFCLGRNCAESNSLGRSGHQATVRTPKGPVQNCPTLAADVSLPTLVESANLDCSRKKEIHGDRRSQFPDN